MPLLSKPCILDYLLGLRDETSRLLMTWTSLTLKSDGSLVRHTAISAILGGLLSYVGSGLFLGVKHRKQCSATCHHGDWKNVIMASLGVPGRSIGLSLSLRKSGNTGMIPNLVLHQNKYCSSALNWRIAGFVDCIELAGFSPMWRDNRFSFHLLPC